MYSILQYIAFLNLHAHTQYTVPFFFFSLSRGWVFDVLTHTELNSCARRLVQSALAVGIDGLHHLMSQSARVLSKNLLKKLLKTNTSLLNMAGWIIETSFLGQKGLCSEAVCRSFLGRAKLHLNT